MDKIRFNYSNSFLKKNMHRGHLVIWSFVKIENGMSKSATIIINIYIYLIVKKVVFPKSKMTKMTLTKMTTLLYRTIDNH